MQATTQLKGALAHVILSIGFMGWSSWWVWHVENRAVRWCVDAHPGEWVPLNEEDWE